MTRDQFEKLFEEYQEDVRRVVLDKFQGNAALADDAVQNAAVYVLGRIGRFKQITKSYFLQLVVNNARMLIRGEGRRQERTVSVGHAADLVEIEHQAEVKRRGRVLPHQGADRQHGSRDLAGIV